MSVWHEMHTFWRFADAFSRMPSVSAAFRAASIHSGVGRATPASSTAMSSAVSTRECDMVSAQVNFTFKFPV